MNKYNFQDYSLSGLFNDVYAIEPEISKEFLDNEFNYHDYHRESNTIYELINVHKGTSEQIQNTYQMIHNQYKDKFPLGSNNHLSGGVHFHIFKGDYKQLSGEKMKYNLFNLPLFGKIKGQKLYLRNTKGFSRFSNYISTNSKNTAVSYKTSYHSHNREGCAFRKTSIEFRCNNVFDARMYGYYVGIIIANKEGMKFKKTSLQLREYLQTGITQNFSGMGADINLDKIAGYRISDADFSAMSVNILRIIKLLEEHTLLNAAIALQQYVNEIGFDIQYEVGVKDSFTGEKIEGNHIKVKGFRLFRVDTGDMCFNKEENFYLFIHKRLKERLLYAGIAGELTEISMEAIEKKYKKLLIINTDTNETLSRSVWHFEESLFEPQSNEMSELTIRGEGLCTSGET